MRAPVDVVMDGLELKDGGVRVFVRVTTGPRFGAIIGVDPLAAGCHRPDRRWKRCLGVVGRVHSTRWLPVWQIVATYFSPRPVDQPAVGDSERTHGVFPRAPSGMQRSRRKDEKDRSRFVGEKVDVGTWQRGDVLTHRLCGT